MCAPLVIPPCMPPELLVLVVSLGTSVPFSCCRRPVTEGSIAGAVVKASLCIEPGTAQPPKPLPMSKPLVAGIESIACASMASSLSKTGSPSPTGQLRTTQVTVPPMLSFWSR